MAKVENLLISDFYTKSLEVDFARDNHFRVTDIVPTPSLGINFDTNELIYARSAKVPARDITNVEAKYMGMTFNLPGIAVYPESASYTLEFYVDKNSSIRNKFEQWSRRLFDDGTSTGNYSVPGRDAYIELTQVDAAFNAIQKYKLVGVSIRSVGDVTYEIAEGTGAVKTFSVTMAYHYYELDNTGAASDALNTVGP